MLIVLSSGATEEQIQHVVERIEALSLTPIIARGASKVVINVIGEEDRIREAPLSTFPGVEFVMPVLKPYKIISREGHEKSSVVDLGKGAKVGGGEFLTIAGPCCVEGCDLLFDIARKVKADGAGAIRGGAFKPRTSPYSFQGLGEEGLKYLADVSKELNIPVVTEVMDTRDVELVERYADVFQIGARNMQNFNLLKEVGLSKKPIILKRGMSASVQDLLLSAEYIASAGNLNIILCERGIRTFETSVRNSLDISSIPVLKSLTHLPVIVDPSHAAGTWEYVEPLALAGVAAGADGIIVEVHTKPEEALSDGPQALLPERFKSMVQKMNAIRKIVA